MMRLTDVAEAATEGASTRSHVIVGSDNPHAGPDTAVVIVADVGRNALDGQRHRLRGHA